MSSDGMRKTAIVWMFLSACNPFAHGADNEQLKTALAFKPSQEDVEYDLTDPGAFGNYKMTVERRGKSAGWVVTGQGGLPVRRFVDSNGDNVVDQWRYYQNGTEVYRDLDTNFNNKVDQARWMNAAGSRWGVDVDEDGKIDEWKQISAEEVSREAVRALVRQDIKILNRILVNSRDLKQLDLPESLNQKILEAVADSEKKLARSASDSGNGAKMSWMRFDSPMPCLIPAQQDGIKQDLLVYENAMAIVDRGGKPGFIQLGELIRLGETWKLARIPSLLEGDSAQMVDSGLFFTTNINRDQASTPSVDPNANPEMQKLLERLQKLDQSLLNGAGDPQSAAKLAVERADLIEALYGLAQTDEEREQWMRQLVDGINASIQTGDFPKGFERLESLRKKILAKTPKSAMVPYIEYRKMLGDYTLAVSEADNAKRASVQEGFLKDLERFVKAYPNAEDAPQASLQLAVTHEFNNKQKEAQEWYSRLSRDYKDSAEGKKALGALNRMDLKGKVLEFSGSGLDGSRIDVANYRGQIVAVFFWATWCVPCTDDLPKIRELYERHHPKGFEIIGVNLDHVRDDIKPYLDQHKVNWPQIHEPGGLETSAPALQFGIATVPTIFLLDKSGKVLNRATTIPELKEQLESLLK